MIAGPTSHHHPPGIIVQHHTPSGQQALLAITILQASQCSITLPQDSRPYQPSPSSRHHSAASHSLRTAGPTSHHHPPGIIVQHHTPSGQQALLAITIFQASQCSITLPKDSRPYQPSPSSRHHSAASHSLRTAGPTSYHHPPGIIVQHHTLPKDSRQYQPSPSPRHHSAASHSLRTAGPTSHHHPPGIIVQHHTPSGQQALLAITILQVSQCSITLPQDSRPYQPSPSPRHHSAASHSLRTAGPTSHHHPPGIIVQHQTSSKQQALLAITILQASQCSITLSQDSRPYQPSPSSRHHSAASDFLKAAGPTSHHHPPGIIVQHHTLSEQQTLLAITIFQASQCSITLPKDSRPYQPSPSSRHHSAASHSLRTAGPTSHHHPLGIIVQHHTPSGQQTLLAITILRASQCSITLPQDSRPYQPSPSSRHHSAASHSLRTAGPTSHHHPPGIIVQHHTPSGQQALLAITILRASQCSITLPQDSRPYQPSSFPRHLRISTGCVSEL